MLLAHIEYELDLHSLYYSDDSDDSTVEFVSTKNTELDEKFKLAIKNLDLDAIKNLVNTNNYDITSKINNADTILDRIYDNSTKNDERFVILKYALQTSSKQKQFSVDDLQYGLLCMLENAPLESIMYIVDFKPETFKGMTLYDHNIEDLNDNIYDQASKIKQYLREKGIEFD